MQIFLPGFLNFSNKRISNNSIFFYFLKMCLLHSYKTPEISIIKEYIFILN